MNVFLIPDAAVTKFFGRCFVEKRRHDKVVFTTLIFVLNKDMFVKKHNLGNYKSLLLRHAWSLDCVQTHVLALLPYHLPL